MTSTQGSGSGNQLAKSTEVPVWSGFNSLVSDTMPVMRIGTPPLIAAPAHEWQTLLTFLGTCQKLAGGEGGGWEF